MNNLAKLADRDLYLWGAGRWGRVIGGRLQKNSIPIAGFLDSAAESLPALVLGRPVARPEPFLAEGPLDRRVLVVTPQFFRETMLPQAEAAGYVRGENLFTAEDFTPHHYVVEVSGYCNLRCPSCPRGRRQPAEDRPGGLMSLADFQQVLAKIKSEDPLAANLQLYQWGEPLLNPDLPAMIEAAGKADLPVSISSNLNLDHNLEPVIAAGPDWFRVSLSGCGPDYEITHFGGRWAKVSENLKRLSQLKAKFNSQMKVEVYYHLYKHNQGPQLAAARSMCLELGFEFQPVWAYLISLDEIRAAAAGGDLPPEARQAAAMMPIDYRFALETAYGRRARPCLVDQVVMVDWDLRVPVCMMFYYRRDNTLAADYLQTSLAELMSRRSASGLCAECRQMGLHRYCDFYYNHPLPGTSAQGR